MSRRLALAAAAALALGTGCADGPRIEPAKSATPDASENGPTIERIEIAGPHRLSSMRHYLLQLSRMLRARCRAGTGEAELFAVIESSGHVLEARVEGGDWQFRRCARRALENRRFPRRGGKSLVYAAVSFRG